MWLLLTLPALWAELGDAGQPVSGPLRVHEDRLYVGTTNRGLMRFTPE